VYYHEFISNNKLLSELEENRKIQIEKAIGYLYELILTVLVASKHI